jgi:prepilin-type N-terminal cleavage/methylation domain-containing protein/prepilin-type processing-associated H-X9-DG protein
MIDPTRIGLPRGTPQQGFTLVELLVSITLIMVLAALVFAVTGKIRTNAQQANLVSAMRQIGLANVGYYSEHNGDINVIRDATEKGSYEGTGGRWVGNSFMGRMQPYLFSGLETSDQKKLASAIKTSLGELLGTSDLKTMAGTPFSGVPVTTDASAIPNPIAINDRLRPKWGNANPPQRVSSYGDPSGILYMTYGRYYFNPLLGETYAPLPRAGDNRRAIYFLPNRKGIFCFLDGHVEMLAPPIDEHRFGVRPPDL